MIHVSAEALLYSAATLSPARLPPARPLPFTADGLRRYSLRDYQLAMLLAALDLMRQGHRRVLIQAPTGAGKTVLSAAMLGATSAPSQFIVHRKELIRQTSVTFAESGIEHGFVAAGWPVERREVMLAGVQTLANRLHLVVPPEMIVLDEAHHATAATWNRVLSAYPDAWIVGLTATPQRLDGRGLDDHFDALVLGPSVAWLIEQGWLSPFTYYAPDRPDLSGVATVAGDFARGAAATVMDRPKLIGDIVEHYLSLAAGRQGIGFAASREHSRRIVDAFQGSGIRAAHIDGSMSDRERDRLVEAFRAGDVQLLSNVDLFGEGFDVPGIVYCGLWRPTQSLALHLQQCGRALRPMAGKAEAIICDHAANAFRHGLPDDERDWSLEGRASRPRGAGTPTDSAPVRQCMACYRVSPSTVAVCPGCATAFPPQLHRIETEVGRLTKLEREELRRAAARDRKAEEKACKSYAELHALAVARGYRKPEAWARLKMSFKTSYRRS